MISLVAFIVVVVVVCVLLYGTLAWVMIFGHDPSVERGADHVPYR
jgi:hypothetical protein